MDNKRLFAVMIFMLIVIVSWRLFVNHELKVHPDWAIPEAPQASTAPATPAASQASTQAVPSTGPAVAAGTTPATSPAGPTAPAQGVQVVGANADVVSTLGSAVSDDPTYPLQLMIDAQGAGLQQATLNTFWATADHKHLLTLEQPYGGLESLTRPLATRWITINGQQLDVSDINWTLAHSDRDSATYTARVDDSGKPLLLLSKTFHVKPRANKDDTSAYEITVEQTCTNAGGKPITVHETLNGPTSPPRENDRSDDRTFITGNDEGDHVVTNARVSLGSLGPQKVQKDLVSLDTHPLLWFGTSSAYFEALIVPDYAGKPGNPPVKVVSAVVAGLDSGTPGSDDLPTACSIDTSDVTLAPQASSTFSFNCYLGPRSRQVLENGIYAAYPRRFDSTLVNSSGMCGLLTFGWLVNLLYGVLWLFHKVTFDWGLSIICLVVLVRALLHPVTKRSQVQLMSMSKMQPEIERLKKKYGDDREELNKAMVQVYKQQGIAPILGCLPQFLQFPIWLALWGTLGSTFELRQATFLRHGWFHLTWIKDLSKPDSLVHFAAPVSLLFFKIQDINILPVLLAIVSFVSQQLMPMPANMTPEQEQQRKMMKWLMPFIFPVMLYSQPSGLNLYIVTSMAIGIVESKIVRDHIKQRDEAEKAGRVFVESAPSKTKRPAVPNRKKGDEDEGQTGIMGAIGRRIKQIQDRLEDARRDAERRGKDRA